MDTVRKAHLSNNMDFREALCYGIEQQKFLLRRKIEMNDDTSDEATVVEEYTKMESTQRLLR